MLPTAPHPALAAYDSAPQEPERHAPEEIADRIATLATPGAPVPHGDVRARFSLPTEDAPIAWDPRAVDDLDELAAEHAAEVVGEVGRFATLGIGEVRALAPWKGPRRARSAFGALARVAERAARAGGVLPSPAPRPRVLALTGVRVFVHREGVGFRVVAVFRTPS